MPQKAHRSDEYRAIPEILLDMRASAGLTQRELAERVERPQSWVHNCERGDRRVDLAEFVAWARACGRTPRAALDRYLRSLGD